MSTVAGGAPPPTPNAALKASIGGLSRVIAASDGSIYFTSLHCVFRVDASGTLTRIAGTGRAGYSGDGGPATAAQLNTPAGIALDQVGNLYIADSHNGMIRRVSRDGAIDRYAGTGNGFGGDGGPARDAQLFAPQDLVIDAAGNLFIADTENRRIRKITASGTISTIAGTGSPASTGDGGLAASAAITRPFGLALDAAGNLYLADNGTRVRKIDAHGMITIVAGTGVAGFSGDGGAAIAARISGTQALAIDPAGNLLLADASNRRVRRVSSDGLIATVAGNGDSTAHGDGGPAVSAGLENSSGIAIDGAGAWFIADSSRVRRVGVTGVISTVAGDGSFNFSGDGGPATSSQVGLPSGVAIDGNGSLYFAESGNNRIRKVTRDGVVQTVAGDGTFGSAGNGGPATSAQIAVEPYTGLAVDKDGGVYFGDWLSGQVRKISTNGVITRFAGGAAGTSDINAIAIDPSGNLYYTLNVVGRVRKVTPAGVEADLATNVSLSSPTGLAVDSAGNLYVSSLVNLQIRKVTPSGVVTTYAGTGGYDVLGDGGLATKAGLEAPGPLAMGSDGTLFLLDGSRMRTVSPSGIINTLFVYSSEYSGDGGLIAGAGLQVPVGVATDTAGNVYIADAIGQAVRKLQPGVVTGEPSIAAVTNGASNRQSVLAPGEIVVLYGSGLGPAELTRLRLDAGLIATELAGTQVMVNGVAAPILYTSASQVAAIVPYGNFNPAHISVTFQGTSSTVFLWGVDLASPAFFTADSSGSGQAAAVNQSGSLNGPGAPAPVGSVIQLYATGEGATTPNGVNGKPAAAPYPVPVLPVTVSIGGRNARVLYAGGAPGATAGLMQINVEIPAGTAAGNSVSVLLQVGDKVSPDGVVIAISEK